MPDDPKRRPSVRRARVDARAESSQSLPQAESVHMRGRRGESAPPPSRAKERPTPPPTQRALPRAAGAADAAVDPATLRRRLAALQQELTTTQHRLASVQEERSDEADRFAEALAAMAGAEQKVTALRNDLARVTADLEQERETSKWLRTAGEQATREAAALRAKASLPSMPAVGPAVSEEIERLAHDLETTRGELDMAKSELERSREGMEKARDGETNAREGEAKAREELASAMANAAALETDVRKTGADLEAVRADLNEAKAAAERLEKELAPAKDRAAGAAKAEDELAAARAEVTRLEGALDAARTEANEATKRNEAAAGASKAELTSAKAAAQKAIADLQREHVAIVSRAKDEWTKKFAEAHKDSEEQLGAMAKQLSAKTEAITALEGEKDALAEVVEWSDARAKTVTKELESTTEKLAALLHTLDTLEQTEEQVAKLRVEARDGRLSIADQAVSIRLALSHAAEAAAPSEVAAESRRPGPL